MHTPQAFEQLHVEEKFTNFIILNSVGKVGLTGRTANA